MRRDGRQGTTTVLTSGGVDSTACIAFYRAEGRNVAGLFFDYGQLAATQELRAAKAVSKHYDVPLEVVHWRSHSTHGPGLIQGRNAALLTTALMECDAKTRVLGIGIHAGTPYVDCGQEFARLMQSVFDLYTCGAVQLGTPFLRWSKGDIIAYCESVEAPLHLTYSCERGTQKPCRHCDSCVDRQRYACS